MHDGDYWAFHQRSHGLLELVLGDREFSFPTILPQAINLPLVRSFLAPLVPDGLSCVLVNAWHNGMALDSSLVRCFDGFLVQITVACGRTLLDNLLAAAPTVSLRMHQEVFGLPDPLLVQAVFVPGDTLMSSRAMTAIAGRDVIVTTLQAELRRRFLDMEHVGFEILAVHQSVKWHDPVYSPHKDRAVVVYTYDYLRRDASVFLRLSLPPYRDEGAIYCPCRLTKRLLVLQLGLQLVCGVDGDNCFCSLNDAELTSDEAAVEDAAFLSCWMFPVEIGEAIETLTVADTISVRSAASLAEQNHGSGNPPLLNGLGGPLFNANLDC